MNSPKQNNNSHKPQENGNNKKKINVDEIRKTLTDAEIAEDFPKDFPAMTPKKKK